MGVLASVAASALAVVAGPRVVEPIGGDVAAKQAELAARPSPMGGAGTLVSAGVIEDIDQNAEVRGSRWYGQPGQIGLAGKMLRDQAVAKSIDYILHPITSATWRFRPFSRDPLDVEVARFATRVFFDRLPWSQIVRRVGVSYFANGFALEEMTDDIRAVSRAEFPNHPRPEGALVPTGFHQRPAWSVFRWHPSKEDPARLESVEQYIRGGDSEKAGLRTVPAERLVRWTWDQDGADFEGLAILRKAYGPWKLKMLFERLRAQGIERHAVGNPVAIAGQDATPDEVRVAEEVLSAMRSNATGHLVLPSGWTFAWHSGGPGADVGAAIDACDDNIAQNVGAGYMRLGLADHGKGSNALAGTQQGHLHLEVDTHAKYIASVLWLGSDGWSPVERIIRANYGDDVAIPRPEVVNLPTRNWQETSRVYFDGVAKGALRADASTEDAIREAIGLPAFDESTAIVVKEAAVEPQETTEAPGAEDKQVAA